MHKGLLKIGAVMSAFAVALGAFGAHGLKKLVSAESVAVFDTGVRYQIYHSLAILLIGIIAERFDSKNIIRAGYSFMIGIFLFSGSLYLLTFFKAKGVVGLSGVGIITPVGGIFFILGWILLLAGLKGNNKV